MEGVSYCMHEIRTILRSRICLRSVFSASRGFNGTTIQTCHLKITIDTNIITFNINIILLLILILTYCCVINQLLFLIKESSGDTFEL